ncbi:MAG: DUF695 domain-containing protein [Planctomycetota bacterium]
MSKVLQVLERDMWAGADGEDEAGPFLLRFRTPVIGADETGDHQHNLTVLWPYADEDRLELPEDDVSEAMNLFEDRLCAAWEEDGLAFLAAVLTFDGARQWVFYTRDVEECGKRLEAMSHEEEQYPIELNSTEDPRWEYVREDILGAIGWQEHQADWEAALLSDDPEDDVSE